MRAMIVEQFGFAMIPPFLSRHLMSFIASALISGITKGTSGAMRKAEELSTTTAPESLAIGPNFLLIPPPAEKRAMSTSSKDLSVSSSTVISCPLKVIAFPAERADARSLSDPIGKSLWSSSSRNSCPTAPVAPTMATLGSSAPAIATQLALLLSAPPPLLAARHWFWRGLLEQEEESPAASLLPLCMTCLFLLTLVLVLVLILLVLAPPTDPLVLTTLALILLPLSLSLSPSLPLVQAKPPSQCPAPQHGTHRVLR
mmetsp:Transcript_31425/g.67841  ORF Transcript_31425/g.67841 Transcript_31425/m.67841 type:complete len:257 (+) Transcript_31425:756-1526(+)